MIHHMDGFLTYEDFGFNSKVAQIEILVVVYCVKRLRDDKQGKRPQI